MKKKKAPTAAIAIAAIVLVVIGGISYYFLVIEKEGPPGEGPTPEEGAPEARIFELPNWEAAAGWSFNLFSELENKAYAMTVDFIGESTLGGEAYYQLNYSFNPPIGDLVTNSKAWLKKDTLMPTKVQYLQGDNLLTESIAIYTFSENMWPLRVDKEFTLIENRVSEGTVLSYLVRVETIENVTTPAGVFECPKIVYYRNNTATKNEWYSPQIKWYVKTEDKQFKQTIELQSY